MDGVGPPISGAISKAMKLPHLSLMQLDDQKIVVPKIFNGGTPKSSILIGISIVKSSILGYPYFWKHPCKAYPMSLKIIQILTVDLLGNAGLHMVFSSKGLGTIIQLKKNLYLDLRLETYGFQKMHTN